MENQRKSTGRYGGQSDSKQDKQTLKEKRKKKKKNSWFRNSRISVLVVLVLLL
jgi:cytoskeletal protein RodZ